jgi:hypothetical protein
MTMLKANGGLLGVRLRLSNEGGFGLTGSSSCD